MGNWQPDTIRRFVKGFPTSARTALVETDIGPGYLKTLGGPEGPHTLASEVIATQLAAWFGLTTLDWAIIAVDEIDEIPFVDREGNQIGRASPGPAFITRAEMGVSWGGGNRELKLLMNPEDISRLVVFDTWVLNCDRHSPVDPKTGIRRKPNRDNVFLSEAAPAGQFILKAIDHTHCFTCGREWTRRLKQVDTIKDGRIFGLFPEFRGFLTPEAVVQAAADLNGIAPQIVKELAQRIPKEWDVSPAAMDALIDLIVRRAAYVAETIESHLWPQGSLFSDDEAGEAEK